MASELKNKPQDDEIDLAAAGTDEEVDVTNYQAVCTRGRDELSVMAPKRTFSKKEALVHAAWLVALAEREEGEFAAILEKVKES
jgi:hypothetical protein